MGVKTVRDTKAKNDRRAEIVLEQSGEAGIREHYWK
jgi:hypothetical protein